MLNCWQLYIPLNTPRWGRMEIDQQWACIALQTLQASLRTLLWCLPVTACFKVKKIFYSGKNFFLIWPCLWLSLIFLKRQNPWKVTATVLMLYWNLLLATKLEGGREQARVWEALVPDTWTIVPDFTFLPTLGITRCWTKEFLSLMPRVLINSPSDTQKFHRG